jgi:aminopeptidase YwaD
MVNRASCIILALLLIHGFSFSQKLKKADKVVVASLKADISYLADDKLEGRRAGTNGEKLAREYISAQFQKAGLQPKADNNSWYQSFEIKMWIVFIFFQHVF